MSLLPTPPPSSLRRKEICCAIYLAYKDEGNKIKKSRADVSIRFFPSPSHPIPLLVPFDQKATLGIYFLCCWVSQSVLLEQFQMYTHTHT